MPNALDDSFLFGEQDNTVGSTTDFSQDALDDTFLFEDKKPEDKGIISSALDTVSGVADTAVDTVEAIPKYVKGFFEGGGAAVENRRSIASKINASLESAQIGIASGLSQAGKATNEFFGYEGKDALTDALDGYVKDNSTRVSKRLDTAIKNLQSEEAKQKLTPEGEFFREAGTSALETTGSMLAGGAAKSVSIGIAAMAPQVFGQSYNELKKEGEGEKGAVLHGAAKTAIELASEILPLKKLFNLPEGVVRKIADMTLVEGGTEMASSIGDSLYDASIRDKNLDWSKEWDKAVKSFQLGAAAGGMIGGVAAAPQITAKTGEAVVDSAVAIKDKATQFKNSLGQKPVADVFDPDQAGQPSELFNPTHKAGGGVDVQVATKNGKIIPDTYVDEQGNSIRDANAVPNNPDESVNVENDVSAVAAKIKAEVFGTEAAPENISAETQANDVIASLESQNQQAIDSEFAAPTPEPINQQAIDSQNFEPTQAELNQKEIDAQSEIAPVAGQTGLPAEVPVTQPEINQKKIDSLAAADLIPTATDSVVEPKKLQPAEPKPIKRLKPKSKQVMEAEPVKPKRLEPKSKQVTEEVAPPEIQEKIEAVTQEPAGETTQNIESVANEQAATSPKNDLPLPTDAQKESGNYTKAHVKVQGMDITIENPKGSKREGVDPNGEKWSVTMPSSYGYFKGTTGADSAKGATGNKIEQLDVYIGDKPESQEVFIVNQQDPSTGKFDELKVVVGSENIKSAMDIYYGGFSDKTGGSRAKSVYQVNVSDFKDLIKQGFGNKEVLEATDSLKKISPLQLKKLARQAGATETVSQSSKQDTLNKPDTFSKKEPAPEKVSETKHEVTQNETQSKPVQKSTEAKNETQAQGDNQLGNEGAQSPDVKDPYRAMANKEISYDVDVEETGETFKVTVDAATVMKEIDTRLDALQELRGCI